MRSSRLLCAYKGLLTSSALLLAPRKKPSFSTPPIPQETLADRFPTFAKQWVKATSSKLLQPQHVTPDSLKLVLWRCPHCEEEFKKRVDHYVGSGGQCPACAKRPSLGVPLPASKKKLSPKVSAEVDTERAIKSVSDGQYLTQQEKRNLQPMLAKNYEKECDKIDFDHHSESLFISPKLDGIRCVAAYDKSQDQILFFSRAGTLFDCCDALIRPHLRCLFEQDTGLVLDGELYNDFSNQKRLRKYLQSKEGKKSDASDIMAAALPSMCRTSRADSTQIPDISFEQLVSAVRTSKAKQTPEVVEKQKLLQYHIFDIMYSSRFTNNKTHDGTLYPFSFRYNLLQSLLREANRYNQKHLGRSLYQTSVLQVVPAIPVQTQRQIDDALTTAMRVGFEGIMIRRETLDSVDGEKGKKTVVKKAKRSVKKSKKALGGYEYGKRSSALLKYKKMQDAEFTIVGAVEGKGKLKGRLGAFVCRSNQDKNLTFTVTPATNEGMKKEMWKKWATEYKGKALTVQYQDITADGIPRFPVGKCVRGAANGEDWI